MLKVTRLEVLAVMLLFSQVMPPAVAANKMLLPSGVSGVEVVKTGKQTAQTYRYEADTRSRATRQGRVLVSGLGWQCQGSRCVISGPWPNPSVSACQALAREVGVIRSYGHAGKKLSAAELKRCNADIEVSANKKSIPPPRQTLKAPVSTATKLPQATVSHKPIGLAPEQIPSRLLISPTESAKKSDAGKGGFALSRAAGSSSSGSNKTSSGPTVKTSPVPPAVGGFALPATPGSTSQGSSTRTSDTPAHSSGGFAPAALAGQAHMANALSPQQISQMNIRRGFWEDYQRAIEEQRRRDEAAAQERMRRLSREAYISGADCDDNDAAIHPGLPEQCDHKDNNCDGRVDEGVTKLVFADLDGDGHGDPSSSVYLCQEDINRAGSRSQWLSELGNDCDDHDPDHWHDCPPAGSTR